jgi:heme-degrading monooxygenase HmoA
MNIRKIFPISIVLGIWATISACSLSMPFRSSKALDNILPDALVTIGITHVTLGADSKNNDIFWKYTTQVLDSLPNHKGYLGHKVRKQLFGNEAWTMTVWADERSLNGFVQSDVHTTAIQQGLNAVSKARFVRLNINRSKIPLSWDDAEKIMDEKGHNLQEKKPI